MSVKLNGNIRVLDNRSVDGNIGDFIRFLSDWGKLVTKMFWVVPFHPEVNKVIDLNFSRLVAEGSVLIDILSFICGFKPLFRLQKRFSEGNFAHSLEMSRIRHIRCNRFHR